VQPAEIILGKMPPHFAIGVTDVLLAAAMRV
jgi:hypothetical protein